MSVAPTRGPVQRPGLDRDLTEILQRLDDLERIKPGGGDYVFLEEIALEAPADPLTFDSIDQGYEHLVLELLLQLDDTDTTGSAYIRANNHLDGTDWRQLTDDASSGTFDSGTNDQPGVRIDNIIPITPLADPLFAMLTVKFPYYSHAPVVKGCYWQGISINDNAENVTLASGGGMFVYQIDTDTALTAAITRIDIDSIGSPEFAPGTHAQLYGIRKH